MDIAVVFQQHLTSAVSPSRVSESSAWVCHYPV